MNKQPGILIIDDDVDFVAAIKIMLENNGYNVTVANDPEEGDSILRKEKPDMIILDVMFGSEGKAKGFDFAQKIKHDKQFYDLPILMLTAINTKMPRFKVSPETDGDYLPIDSFLDKPVNTDELLHKVEDLLSHKAKL